MTISRINETTTMCQLGELKALCDVTIQSMSRVGGTYTCKLCTPRFYVEATGDTEYAALDTAYQALISKQYAANQPSDPAPQPEFKPGPVLEKDRFSNWKRFSEFEEKLVHHGVRSYDVHQDSPATVTVTMHLDFDTSVKCSAPTFPKAAQLCFEQIAVDYEE